MHTLLVAEELQVLHERTDFTSSSVESYNSVAHAGALSAGSQLVSLCSEFAQCPSQSVRSHKRSNNTLLHAVHFCYLCTVTLVQEQMLHALWMHYFQLSTTVTKCSCSRH
jgi:hypothetical protein